MACVYRIVGPDGEAGLVYYGTTTGSSQRWSNHKSEFRKGRCASRAKLVFEEYGIEQCSFEIMEQVSKENQVERERWWIENHECVNLKTPGRVMSREEINRYYRERYHALKTVQNQ